MTRALPAASIDAGGEEGRGVADSKRTKNKEEKHEDTATHQPRFPRVVSPPSQARDPPRQARSAQARTATFARAQTANEHRATHTILTAPSGRRRGAADTFSRRHPSRRRHQIPSVIRRTGHARTHSLARVSRHYSRQRPQRNLARRVVREKRAEWLTAAARGPFERGRGDPSGPTPPACVAHEHVSVSSPFLRGSACEEDTRSVS